MTSATLMAWSPRVLGIAMAAFLGLFALDAFDEQAAFVARMGAFAVHLLPAFLVLGVIAVAWRREWFGALAFAALAAFYAAVARDRLDWVLAISAPLLLVGLLYFTSWQYGRE